jgi:2-keto-4-pentenoate hydratase/2-oxohepta-3-ene-1,7-dioic acid hydratase in catechol pathway
VKLLTFKTDKGLALGIKTDKGVLNVSLAAALYPTDKKVPSMVEEVINKGEESIEILKELVNYAINHDQFYLFLNEEELDIGPCVPKPGKIICVGLNYRKHAEESKMPIPEYPVLFNKFLNTISAPGDIISIPYNANQVDYEAELVIVIGKRGKRVTKEEALNYVIGYCAVNDVSARDLQMRTQQWLLGKCCDGFSPIGPYLVTADEVGNPNELGIRAYLNGELRQNSNTSDMIFACNEIVSYISQHMTLEPGDIILTGTPEGVILGFPEDKQVWLKEGDKVTIEIDQLGSLTNFFSKEL